MKPWNAYSYDLNCKYVSAPRLEAMWCLLEYRMHEHAQSHTIQFAGSQFFKYLTSKEYNYTAGEEAEAVNRNQEEDPPYCLVQAQLMLKMRVQGNGYVITVSRVPGKFSS